MDLFRLFRKKKPDCAETGNAGTVSEAKPKNEVVRGSFSNVDAAYQVIGNILSDLEQLGFHLAGIRTSGETSGHDWTEAYDKSYSTFAEFSGRAKTDYQQACAQQAAGAPALDWDATYFLLNNRLTIRLYALNSWMPEHRIYRAGWAVYIPEDMTAEDALAQKTLDVLRKYE